MLLTALAWSLLLLCFCSAYQLMRGRRVYAWPWLLLGSAFILVQAGTAIYRIIYNGSFELAMMLDINNAVVPTLVNIYGKYIVLFCAVLVPYLLFTVAFILAKLCKRIRLPRRTGQIALALLAGWIALSPATFVSHSFPNISDFLDLAQRQQQYAGQIGTLVPEFTPPTIEGGAPVIIVQLESVSSMAADGLATGDGPGAMARYLPEFTKIAKQGVLVPYMWGTTVETHRAQAGILCGSVTDARLGIATARRPLANCLPNILKPQGYKSYFMSAYWDGSFANTENLMRKAGFDHINIGDMMRHGDKVLSWGYEDCGFYKRSMTQLRRKYKLASDGRSLLYFALSAHHYIFIPDSDYADIWPFTRPVDFAQRYLNSLAMQDRCLSTFLEETKELRKKAHVFIMGDHSWPVGISGYTLNKQGTTSENFLTPMLYLPPLNDGDRYRRGETVHTPLLGQADIAATVLELLSGKPYPNSFAPLLRKGKTLAASGYEDCQVSTQPYEGIVVNVLRGRDKHTYYARDQRLETSTLDNELLESKPTHIERGVSYKDFKDRFMCNRYRALQAKTL